MLRDALRALAGATEPFILPALTVDQLYNFIALRTTQHSAPLQSLCDRCVAQLDRFRRPMDSAELAQRRASGLTENQEALLMRYGYPYVMTEWRFHITLSEPVVGTERDVLMSWLKGYFAAALAAPIQCEDVCLFVQDGASAPFLLRERFAFRAAVKGEE